MPSRKKRSSPRPRRPGSPSGAPGPAARDTAEGNRLGLAFGALAVATLAAFAGVFRNGFVSFDDELYVLRNPHVMGGLSWADAVWAWTSSEAANWHPLTWLSHMTDVSLFGLAPAGHHATSLLLHLANVLLLFALLRAATGRTGRSAAAAALFAVHPLRVETVAWVSERKDVLSLLFGLLTIAAYARWARRREPRLYAAALLLFAASLMSKSTLVTLPALLLVLDFWPLLRLRFASAPNAGEPADKLPPEPSGSLSRLVVEKIPFAVLAVAAGAWTFRAQRLAGATEALSLPWSLRLENALVSAVGYLGKTFWPARLAVLYPHPATSLGWRTALAALFLLAITAAAVLLARRRPYLLAGWVWYLVSLLPVIGLVQVGWQAAADRYTYVPSLGLAVALVWGIADAAAGRVPARALAAATVVVVGLLGARTVQQVAIWRDSLSLFEHAVAVTGPNETMQIDLGNELARRGRTEEAGQHFAEALRIAPGSKEALYALGSLASREGRLDQALSYYSDAVGRHPDFAEARVQLASVLVRQRRLPRAFDEAAKALEIRPGMPEALYVEGVALESQGRSAEAEVKYRAALAGRPGYAEAHENLGELLQARGRTQEAVGEFEAALAAKPDFAEARQSLESLKRKGAAATPVPRP